MKRKLTSPKNILITHVYSSDNKGDAALTSVLIDDLKRRFPRAELAIVKLDKMSKNEEYEGIEELPAFMHYILSNNHHPLIKLTRAIYMIPATLLWAVWFRFTGRQLYLPAVLRETARKYAAADLVVAVGGGYIRSRKGLMNRWNIPLLLHALLFAHMLRKPTVLYSQSIGPFVHWYEVPMVAFVLRRMSLIMLRENTSKALLARMSIVRNVMRTIDSGFLLVGKGKQHIRKKYHIAEDTLVVGVTVRSWLEGEAQTAYEQSVAGALDTLVKRFKVHILFIPQVTAAKGDDDRVVSRRVHGFMRHADAATVINKEFDHYELKAIYDELDVLLGTRFHSVIFSLTSFVPVLAIEYEHKTSGIMHDLKLEDWVIKIEDVAKDNLAKLLHKLVRERETYHTRLRTRIPPYVEQARQTVDSLAEVI